MTPKAVLMDGFTVYLPKYPYSVWSVWQDLEPVAFTRHVWPDRNLNVTPALGFSFALPDFIGKRYSANFYRIILTIMNRQLCQPNISEYLSILGFGT